jgi:outer membrane protein, heavy metal efflux system
MISKPLVVRGDWAVVLWLFTTPAFSQVSENPLFAGSGDFSADLLVEAVLSRNPGLPAMRAALEAAGLRSEQVSALDDPRLSYRIAPQTAGVAGLDFGQEFQFSQALPWPGKLRLRGEAARYEADSVQEDLETLRLSLAARAKSLFADWYFIHEAIRINRTNQDLLKDFRGIALTRYGTGLANKQDALRADVEVNLLQHQAIVLEREKQTILAGINTLLNRGPDDPLPLPQDLPDPKLPSDAASLREQARRSRPELRAQAARIQSLDALTELAGREFYPDLNLSAGYNSLWERSEQRFTVGLAINVPLDQTKRRANESEARARVKRAQWDQIDLSAKIAEEVQVAFEKVRESHHVLELYRGELLPLAEENLEAARADYEAGSGDFLSLISAEKNLLQTQLQTERVLADAHQRLAELERAAGGFEALSAAEADRRTKP